MNNVIPFPKKPDVEGKGSGTTTTRPSMLDETSVHATESDVQFEELSKERDRLHAINEAQVIRIIQSGINIDPDMLLMARLDVMLDMLLADPTDRMRFEINFEQKMSELFEGAESQIAAAKLGVQPSTTASGLILP